MFYKNVDLRNKKKMIDFLTNHFRYYTMNSWNGSTSYANNVKISNLSIPSELKEQVYDIVLNDVDSFELEDSYRTIIDNFKIETGYDAGFNGRSSGYVVMYDTQWDIEKQCFVTYPGRSIDQYEDFQDWRIQDIKDRVKVVQKFDKMCDDLLSALLYFAKNYEIETEEYYTKHSRKVLVKKDK